LSLRLDAKAGGDDELRRPPAHKSMIGRWRTTVDDLEPKSVPLAAASNWLAALMT
jgi:hypothetical protein